MHIKANRKVAFAVLDVLLERYQAKKFPYNHKDAVLPQMSIPRALRADKEALARFYFYICIYMRGGIESLQVFNTYARMWQQEPELFDPYYAQWLNPAAMAEILRGYIGWDADRAGINWVENSKRLVRSWHGNPLRLLRGLNNYNEALRRIRNKLTKRELATAGARGAGFLGFQPKMVSMLIYFYDYEGWLEKRFLYPAPADFHNFRLALNQGALVVPEGVTVLRTSEELSAPWRAVVMSYLRSRAVTPVDVADALWLYSLVMCGNSPLTMAKEQENGSGMFSQEDLPHLLDKEALKQPRFRRALEATCLRCPLVATCRYAIPSAPYYRKGLLVLAPRARLEEEYGRVDPDTPLLPRSGAKNLELW